MRVFLDTNVILDVLMRREPFFRDSARVLYLCESGEHVAGLTTLSACNIAYALRRQLGARETVRVLRSLFGIVEPISTSVSSLRNSLENPSVDFEDTVQAHCAAEWDADAIVTRDKSGFVGVATPVVTPHEFLLLDHRS